MVWSCCCHATATVWHTAGFASPLPQGTDVWLWRKAHCVHRSSQLCYGSIESTPSFPTTHSSWWPNSVQSGGTSMSLKNRTGRDVDSLWPVRLYVSSGDVGTDMLTILWDTWKDKLVFPSKGLYLRKQNLKGRTTTDKLQFTCTADTLDAGHYTSIPMKTFKPNAPERSARQQLV